ncbi:MAG TPA: hypothetical protein VF331_08810 [Polyangiales bacterium]
MALTQIFWALLALPGYALLRRFWPAVREGGPLYVLGLAYVASFALLSPVSIASYALGLPLWVFSAACVLAVTGALVSLVSDRADRDLLTLLRQESIWPWLLLGTHLLLQARVGGFLLGDAHTHLGHIRYLLDHGFSNRDIYLADYHFHHIYHTNLLYALYASLAQLTHQSYLDTWFWTQAWAKLLVAAGCYALGYTLSKQRWVGWLSALVVITTNAGESYTLYPNTLAVGWLLPTALGLGLSTLVDRSERTRLLIGLGTASYLLGQIHSLYAVYLGLLLAPVFLATAALGLLQGERRGWAAVALVALLAGAPFTLISKYAFLPPASRGAATAPLLAAPAPVQAPPDWAVHSRSAAVRAGGGHLEKQLRLSPTGQYVLPPEYMGGSWFVALGWLALLGLGWSQRARLACWLGAALAALVISVGLFVPSACMLLLRLLQEPFAVARLSTVLSTLLLIALCAATLLLAQRSPKPRLAQALLAAAALAAATQLPGQSPKTFREHLGLALAPLPQRRATLEMMQARRELLARTIPSGATVLAPATMARQLVMVCDCFVIAADRGHTHVPDIAERRADLKVLTAPATAWPTRQALLARYGVRQVAYPRNRGRDYAWTREHGRVLGSAGGYEVAELR